MICTHCWVNYLPALTDALSEGRNIKFKDISMLTNNSQEISSGSYIAVPPASNIPTPQVGKPLTTYDYLALIPVLITAATPLILGLKKKDKDKNEDKEDEN
ncbi:hypothetical protein [Nostoc sp.]|uniref:hypothetical protein n=1 Tax=Nostoc sp. TaxID=1180 RepID=UPI002FFB5FD4